MATQNKKRSGRKSKYDTHVRPRFKDIKKWLKRGATDEEIYKALGIGKSAFYEYLKKFPEFSDLIKKNRVDAIEEIKCAMYKKAIGYEYTETETTTRVVDFDNATKEVLENCGINVFDLSYPTVIKTKKVKKHAQPDTGAGLILLQHWAKDEGWTRDPQALALKKEEFKHKKEMDEENSW